MFLDLHAYEQDRHAAAAFAKFTLLQMWPVLLSVVLPGLVPDPEGARRLREVLEVRRRQAAPDSPLQAAQHRMAERAGERVAPG